MRKLFTLATVVVIWAMAGATTPAQVATTGFSLRYGVYVAGFKGGNMEFEVSTAPSRFESRLHVEPAGLFSWFLDWDLDARTAGRLVGGDVVPVAYRFRNRKGDDKLRWVEIDFDSGGPVVARTSKKEDDRKPVPRHLLPGARDLVSTITEMLLDKKQGTVCTPESLVYDGRRLFKMRLEPLPTKNLKSSQVAPYAGRAEGCRITFLPIAGFKAERDRERLREQKLTVWLADVIGDGSKVPVRLEWRGRRGLALAHLQAARDARGRVFIGDD